MFLLMDEALQIRKAIEKDGFIGGANKYRALFASVKTVPKDESTALGMLMGFLSGLLESNKFEAAAALLWGPTLFDPKPYFVRLVWKSMPKESEILIIGAAACGKSYGVAAWLLLDWLRDPLHTCVKVVSATREHAMRNVFAHIKNFHQRSILPLPGDVKAHSIQASNDEKQGIHLVAIPQGDAGAGRLQGFHPSPRVNPHPVFGNLTRIRAILDEAEEIPGGIWDDVDNMLITKYNAEQVKIIAATNPRDKLSKFGLRCEPVEGWTDEIFENAEEWHSRLGWKVIRLDGARCENVIEKEMVVPGMLTWDGYQRYLLLGIDSGEYATMGRGMFPRSGSSWAAIPEELVTSAFKTFEFVNKVTYCAAVDLAFEGGDQVIMTVGKWGRARVDGKIRDALQIDAQFELPKLKTLQQTQQIIETCKKLSIAPEWLCVDRTGNGTGVFDALTDKFGAAVLGVHYGSKSTEKRVLADDSRKACDLYDGVVSELFFGMRKFLEFGYLRINPMVAKDKLIPELSGRKYRLGRGETVRVESKKDYKGRGNKSPDRADSATLLCFLVRMRADFQPEMIESAPKRQVAPRVGVVDALDFRSFN